MQGLGQSQIHLHIEVPVVIQNREVARAVAEYTDDRAARR
jgi:hypothetical protein